METRRLIRRYADQREYQVRLVKHALKVSGASAQQFSIDEKGLSTLLEEIDTGEYTLTRRSRVVMESMLSGIYEDGLIFKEYERDVETLYEFSRDLQRISKLADKTKEESIDVARALMIRLPQHHEVFEGK